MNDSGRKRLHPAIQLKDGTVIVAVSGPNRTHGAILNSADGKYELDSTGWWSSETGYGMRELQHFDFGQWTTCTLFDECDVPWSAHRYDFREYVVTKPEPPKLPPPGYAVARGDLALGDLYRSTEEAQKVVEQYYPGARVVVATFSEVPEIPPRPTP